MESREGELHLRLDPEGTHDLTAIGSLRDVLQQGRLSDPGFAADDESGTLARAELAKHVLESRALIVATPQRGNHHFAT
jgi:hypothetical protein